MKKRGLAIWKQLLIGSFVLLSIIAFSLLWIFNLAKAPYTAARTSAIATAKQYTDLEEVTDFAVFNRRATYYSLQGKDGEAKDLLVLIPEAGGQILVYGAEEGVTSAEAISIAQEKGAKSIKQVTFGVINRQAVWEVSTGQTYYYIGFKKGNLVSKEGL